MEDIVVSLSKNTLRVSLISKGVLAKTSVEVSGEAAANSKITNPENFAATLDQAISELTSLSNKKLRLNFIVEPQDAILRFVTIQKNSGNPVSQVLDEVSEKMEGVELKELYFSYQKIAPFVYQFVGINKSLLENYISISNILGMELRSVVPWIYLLPKYADVNDPAVFLTSSGGDHVIALSELNGIFFSEVYTDDKLPADLNKLIKDLSVYKRKDPIENIYVFNKEDEMIKNDGHVTKLEVPGSADFEDIQGFEANLLVNYILDTNPNFVGTVGNLLTLLPLPVIEKKSSALVYAGAFAAALIIVMAGFGIYSIAKNRNKTTDGGGQMANNIEEQAVLSETVEESSAEDSMESDSVDNVVLNREDLSVRVENGSGINGAAGKTQEFLEGLGYVVPEVDTANEQREATLLKFVPGKASYKDMLVEDMAENYPEVAVEENLEENLGYDVLIVLGTSIQLE